MTETYYIAAIILTGLLCLSYLVKTGNREIDLCVNILLCMGVSAAWSIIAVNEFVTHFFPDMVSLPMLYVASTIFGLFFWCILILITWREPPHILEDNNICYTPETLIGMHGLIINHEDDDLYLGYLNDGCKSQIYIHIVSDEAVKPDTEFVLTEIKGDKIYASVVE